MVTGLIVLTVWAVAVNVPVTAPVLMGTDAGVMVRAVVSELCTLTVVPAGAGPLSLIVPVIELPEMSATGLTSTEVSLAVLVTARFAVADVLTPTLLT